MAFLKDCLPTGVEQFSKEKGDKMSALPATVGGLSVDIPVGTVRWDLAIAELSGSDTVSITISLEDVVWCGTWWWIWESGAAASAALPVSPVEDEQGPLVGGPEVGDIYSVGTDLNSSNR